MIAHEERTSLTVPLTYEGEPIGMLVFVELEEERRYTDDERELATALGEQAASAIHHARLLQTTERQNRQLGLLLESTRAISSSVELDDVLAVVARTTAEALVAEQCQIQEYDSGANTVKPIAFWQRDASVPEPDSMGKVFSLDDEPDERAFLESMEVVQQLYSDPALAAPTRATMEKYGDLSYLNVPLVFGGQSFGVMVLVETKIERRWTADEIALAGALAEQAAVAIERARLYKRVQEQAITDGLTGLFNHRYFYERLDQEVARARRYGTPVSLLMVDIDDFKAFNDRHGHLAGDAVLRQLAGVLRDELRQSLDLAARYGGEEFAIILPNTPMAASQDAQLEMDLAGRLPRARDGEDAAAAGSSRRRRGSRAAHPPPHRDDVVHRARRRGTLADHGEHRRGRVPSQDRIGRGPRQQRRRRSVQGEARRQGPGRELWVTSVQALPPRATLPSVAPVRSSISCSPPSCARWASRSTWPPWTCGRSRVTPTPSSAGPSGAASLRTPPTSRASARWFLWLRAETCGGSFSPARRWSTMWTTPASRRPSSPTSNNTAIGARSTRRCWWGTRSSACSASRSHAASAGSAGRTSGTSAASAI